jgi:hypothetical protein
MATKAPTTPTRAREATTARERIRLQTISEVIVAMFDIDSANFLTQVEDVRAFAERLRVPYLFVDLIPVRANAGCAHHAAGLGRVRPLAAAGRAKGSVSHG